MAAQPSHPPRTARRTVSTAAPGGASRAAVITMAVLGVAAIAACAVLLSYNGIYQIAVRGGAAGWTAHLYPGLFTLLLLMAFWATYLLREAPRRRRIWVDALVLVMILSAAAASALRSFRYELLEWAATLVVAVTPWLALLVSFRLLLWIVAQVRGERVPARRSSAGDGAVDREAVDQEEARHAPDAVPSPEEVSGRVPAPQEAAPALVLPPPPAPTVDGAPPPAPLPEEDARAAAAAPTAPDPFDDLFREEPVQRPDLPEPAPAGPAPDGGGLPKRVPSRGGSAIRQAAGARGREEPEEQAGPPGPEYVDPVDTGADDADWESIADPEDDWETGDSSLADDPAGDEAHRWEPEPSAASPPAAPAEPAAAKPAVASGADADAVPSEPAKPALRSRPVALRPRRSGIPPLRPPSSEVRSSPAPPEE